MGSGKREQPPTGEPEFRVELLLFGNRKKEDFLHVQPVRFALEIWEIESISDSISSWSDALAPTFKPAFQRSNLLFLTKNYRKSLLTQRNFTAPSFF